MCRSQSHLPARGAWRCRSQRSTPKHLPHAGGVTVDQKLIHVDTGRCLAIVVRMLCVPTRRVIAATERKIRQRSKRDTIPRGISCGAVDEGADGNNLRQNVINPERHDMPLRPGRARGIADGERDRRLLRKRIRLVRTENASPMTSFATLVGQLAPRPRRKERACEEPDG